MKTRYRSKKEKSLKYGLRFILSFILFIFFSIHVSSQINFSKNSVSGSYSKATTTNVVYIFQDKVTNYKGSVFTVANSTRLVAILEKNYFLNNKSKVHGKYPNSNVYPGRVIGKPKNIRRIYVEPRLNDKMVIYAYPKYYTNSKSYNSVKIPIKGCENKGDRCKIQTKNSTVYLSVNSASWEPEDYEEPTYPGMVEYKINKIIGVVNLKGSDNPYISAGTSNSRPEYIEFAHPLIPSTGVAGNYPYKN